MIPLTGLNPPSTRFPYSTQSPLIIFIFLIRMGHDFSTNYKLIYKKMVKTIKKKTDEKTKKKIRKPTITGAIIQHLMGQGKTDTEISQILDVPRTTVIYYRKRPVELEVKYKSKLPQEYLDEIIALASNKTTSQMSGGRIANEINEKLKLKLNNVLDEKTKKILSISKRQVNRILKQNFNLRTVKKSFYMTEEQKKKELRSAKNF